jgi:hypothetical protein
MSSLSVSRVALGVYFSALRRYAGSTNGFTATMFVEAYRVQCPDCGVKREKVPLLPGKANSSERWPAILEVASILEPRRIHTEQGVPLPSRDR